MPEYDPDQAVLPLVVSAALFCPAEHEAAVAYLPVPWLLFKPGRSPATPVPVHCLPRLLVGRPAALERSFSNMLRSAAELFCRDALPLSPRLRLLQDDTQFHGELPGGVGLLRQPNRSEELSELYYLARAMVAGVPGEGYAGPRQLTPAMARHFADCLREAADVAESRQRAFEAQHAGG